MFVRKAFYAICLTMGFGLSLQNQNTTENQTASMSSEANEVPEKSLNFLEEIIDNDLKAGKHKTILTRFPP